MTQRKALNQIKRLEHMFETYQSFLSRADIEQCQKSLIIYKSAYDKGLFAPMFAYELENMQWDNRVNIRYGYKSIMGFSGEVLAVGLWNMYNQQTHLHLGDGNKTEELNGRDVFVTNPKWLKTFPVQVKAVRKLEKIYPHYKWFIYSTSKLQRFVLADVVHKQALYVNYEQFEYYCSGKKYIALDVLMKKKHLHPLLLS